VSNNNSIHDLYWIDASDPGSDFPPVDSALTDPDGLLAFGGDLSVGRLIKAYRQGIFPWFSDGQPIMWWSPNPRTVLLPENLNISRSLAKTCRKQPYAITCNNAFADVIHACAQPRADGEGTWITEEMQRAYCALHAAGYAHSVEAWQDGQLVGGLYGIAIGRVFFGESMFAHANDASKIAFVHLVRQLQAWGFKLVDCQVDSAHLQSLGASQLTRPEFIRYLDTYCDTKANGANWRPHALTLGTD